MSPTSSIPSPSRPLLGASGEVLRALVIEDEPNLADVLVRMLVFDGWRAEQAYTGTAALAVAERFQPDVAVLDVMLPDTTGLEVLRELRLRNPAICVLFLTAKDSLEDRIAGITAGGDDYVTKPFSFQEVSARLRGLVRRAGLTQSKEGSGLRVADLRMDEEAHEVRRAGQVIELTATEFELLRFLMRNQRVVLSKAQILDRVWSYDFGGGGHVVELYISYLRKKLDSLGPPSIHTVRGVGYVIKPAAR
jgi:two-component system OmpR family response regulator